MSCDPHQKLPGEDRAASSAVHTPTPPPYVLKEGTITLPFPLHFDDLERLLFLASIERTGSGRAAAKLLGRSVQWASQHCHDLDIPSKQW